MQSSNSVGAKLLMTVFRTLSRRGLNPVDTMVETLREYVITGDPPPLPESPDASENPS